MGRGGISAFAGIKKKMGGGCAMSHWLLDKLGDTRQHALKLVSRALYRRFDDVLYYEHPDSEDRSRLIKNVLGMFCDPRLGWKTLTTASQGLSHSEIDLACRDGIKEAILADRKMVNTSLLCSMLRELQDAHGKRGG